MKDLNPGLSIVRVLRGERMDPPPIWIMRQAGRYLPEYRELRRQAPSFLDFCYSPALATEATLQPIRRYGFDAAILFSDILCIPDALGRKVRFEEGEGPRLEPLIGAEAWSFEEPIRALQRLAPVHEAVDRIRGALPSGVALIGFVGGPWTVATYMLQGKGGEREAARRFAYEQPEAVDALLAVLVECSAQHLAAQVQAGCDVVKIFESWAEGLAPALFERLVIAPTAALVRRLRELGVSVPVIGFPRGAGVQAASFAARTGVNAIGLDHGADPRAIVGLLPEGLPLQGNLDPELLTVGGSALENGVRDVLAAFAKAPHVFNLGHGITPQADPAHVARMVALVRGQV